MIAAVVVMVVVFALAKPGQARSAIGVLVSAPLLMVLLWLALYVWTALTPCEPPQTWGECWYGVGMSSYLVFMISLFWAGAWAFAYVVRWLLRLWRPDWKV
jgi:hypothetical protein